LPWGHIRTILDKRLEPEARDSYSAAAVQHGWSRNVLMNTIMNKTLERTGAAPATPRCTGQRAPQQVAKDPYNFEFLGLSGGVAEGELETALTSRITQTLPGFAFVARQVHFDVRR
jgi:predicted nuclease of restriction endonuclease-like (RecB) superfamily